MNPSLHTKVAPAQFAAPSLLSERGELAMAA